MNYLPLLPCSSLLLSPTECDFIVHRKCEQKVVIDCSARLEQAVLQHDKQVEESAVPEEEGSKEMEVSRVGEGRWVGGCEGE